MPRQTVRMNREVQYYEYKEVCRESGSFNQCNQNRTRVHSMTLTALDTESWFINL
jgi:hypothetical protein